MSAELRAKVVAEAQTWLGTPFHHEARVKGAGVDCGQFVIAVFENVGLIEHIETDHYPPDFHLHRDVEWYASNLLAYCDEVNSPDNLLPGDIVLFKIGRVYSHGAIVVDWPWAIHAYVPRGVARFDINNGQFAQRPIRYFVPRFFK